MKEWDLKYLCIHCLGIASSIFVFTLEGLKNCVAVEAESIRAANFRKKGSSPSLVYLYMFFSLLSVWNASSGRCNMML